MGILSDTVNESKKNCGCGKDPCETYGKVAEGTQGCADCEWISDETDGDITTCDDCAAEKREKTNEAEKRWKQTSMSPEEAIEKYGKENVKVKKGALRNGDDMVEVFVESMNEGGNSVEAFMAHVVDHAKEIQADNYRMTDSSYYEFTDEIDTDDEEFMSMPQVQAILKAIPHVDMENTDIKHAIDVLAAGELLEADTESMNEGGNDVAELVGDVHYHNNHYDRDERKSEMQEDAAKLVMAAKSTGDEDIIASAESVEHLCHHYDYDEAKDMLNNKLQELNQLVGGNELEVEESYSPGDENEDGMVSNCCGAPIMDVYDGHGRCSDCKEMASAEREEEYYESDVSRLKELSGITEAPASTTTSTRNPYGSINSPQNKKISDITNPDDALTYSGSTRGVDDPFDASGTGHADGIGWSQDELDGAMQGFKDVLGTENQIKINRYLAKLPLDIAKGIADQHGYGVFTNPETGARENPTTDQFDLGAKGGYDHITNPNYGADAMDPETIAKIKDPDWRNTYDMKDPKFKNIRPTEATNEEIEAEIQRLKDLIRY